MSFKVMAEVDNERARQNLKWGEQNHPDVHPSLSAPWHPSSKTSLLRRVAQYYAIPTARAAQQLTDEESAVGGSTWLAILVEEVAEASAEAALGDTEKLREELVQVAAVAVQWVEAIDRREVLASD